MLKLSLLKQELKLNLSNPRISWRGGFPNAAPAC